MKKTQYKITSKKLKEINSPYLNFNKKYSIPNEGDFKNIKNSYQVLGTES